MRANIMRKMGSFHSVPVGAKLFAVITLFFFNANMALALPIGQQVVSGQATFARQGGSLTITNTPSSIINWQAFSIGSSEAVRFIQQNGASSVLNRITGQDPSRILGLLQSNGRVFLINPNGILFGQGAKVDVNGLVASTLGLSDRDFLAGRYNFTAGPVAASIRNQGTITTPGGGKVYLIAPDIENSGIITNPKGDVVLAAGHYVQLVDSLDPDIAVVVSAPADKSVNLGQILAQSGRVGIYGGLIAQKGIVNADSAVVGKNGKIVFKATKDITLDAGSVTSAKGGGTIKVLSGMHGGTVTVNGALDASAPNGGDGGFIETSAAKVSIGDNARITTLAPYGKTGTWLIDPADFTIAEFGGDITGAALSSNLNNTSVSILSSQGTVNPNGNGDIFLNNAVSWNSANTLTLSAFHDVNINTGVTNSGGGSLTLRADNSGTGAGTVAFGGGSVSLNGGGTASIFYNPSSYASPTDYSRYFTGVTPTAYMLVNDVNNLQAMNTNLSGAYALGKNIDASATLAWNNGAGFVPIGNSVTPFIGVFDGYGQTVTGLHINLPSTNYVGLIGYNSGNIRNVGLLNVNISGSSFVGGLAGRNDNGSINNSYNSGTVSGNLLVGGLVGENNNGGINNSYNSGTVSGSFFVGGLVGENNNGGINNSYNSGAVSGSSNVGGLAGFNTKLGSISHTYSTGAVAGTSSFGGLVGGGDNSGISSSFWDKTVNSAPALDNGFGVGKTATELKTLATFAGWDIDANGGTGKVWRIYEGNTMPLLRSFLTSLTITAADITKTYDGLAYSSSSSTAYTTNLANADTGKIFGSVGSPDINRGIYQTISAGGLYSTQSGYDITSVNGMLTINPANLTVTANADSKTYNGLPYTGGNGVTYTGFVNNETSTALGGTLVYGGSQGAINAGNYFIIPSGLTSGNYSLTYVSGPLTINKASLTVTANADSKTYNGLAYTGGNGVTYTGFVNNETSTALGGTLAYGGTSQGAINAGNYLIIPSGLTSGNYALTYANGALTVNKASLTVTANDDSKTYNGLAYTGGNGVAYTGFVNNETSTALGGTLAYGGTSQGAINAGNYLIIPSGLTSGNYAISFIDGTLTITPSSSPPVSPGIKQDVINNIIQNLTDNTIVAFGTATGATMLLSGTGDNSIIVNLGDNSNQTNRGGINNDNNPADFISPKRNYCN